GDAGFLLDGGFEVFGMNVDAGGGDDDFAFSAEKAKAAVGLALGQIAGSEPFIGSRPQLAAGPGGAGDGGAAREPFPVGGGLDLAAGHGLADGALRDVKGMIEGDEGRGLRHAIALHEDKAERVPELPERPGERAAAGDERPELEAEGAMHVAIAPPAAERRRA